MNGPRASRRVRRIAAVLPALLAGMALAGCGRGVMQVTPPVTPPEKFSAAGDAAMPDMWWTAFGDDDLNKLMAEALAGNLTVRIAWDRLDQAHAVAVRSGAALWPGIDGSAGGVRTVRQVHGFDRSYRTEYSLGLGASYELDLWGRVRATRRAAILDADASAQDVHAAAITVTAEVARTWYRLIDSRGQLALLDAQIETNGKYLEVIQSRFRLGLASAADVLQQRELIEANRAERVLVELGADVLGNQLAVLLGEVPGSVELDVPESLPESPPLPRAPRPGEWMRRRPDVRAAELRVQSADRRLAAAVADQFPKLGLALSADTTHQQIRSLLDNWVAAVVANLAAPLFDGGMRRAEVARTKAVVSERLHVYGQVILSAVKEVEDALSREARQGDYVESLDKQLVLSKQAMEQTLANYIKGAADFTRYLTTLLSHQRLQRRYLAAERDRLLYRIDLCRALAGSWALDRDPAEEAEEAEEVEQDKPAGELREPAETDEEEMARPVPRPRADRR